MLTPILIALQACALQRARGLKSAVQVTSLTPKCRRFRRYLLSPPGKRVQVLQSVGEKLFIKNITFFLMTF